MTRLRSGCFLAALFGSVAIFAACGSSSATDGGSDSGEVPDSGPEVVPDAGPDAGVDAGADAGPICPDYTEDSSCPWPGYCEGGSCTATVQNLTSAGVDDPSPACAVTTDTSGGTGNLDQDRLQGTGALTQYAPGTDGALITDLNQILVSTAGCGAIGSGATVAASGDNVCGGGATDAAGNPVCATGEVVVLFTGHAIDPKGQFVAAEGAGLDGQFYRLSATGSGTATPMTGSGSSVGAVTTGHIIPGAGWSATGGPFVLARCLGEGAGNYPDIMSTYTVTLHFADTGTVAGNSYCATWQP